MRLLGALAVILLTACTHKYDHPPPVAAGDRFTIKTAGRAPAIATAWVRDGKLVWVTDDGGQVFRDSDVRAYDAKKRGRGAFEGIMIGLGVGAATGAIMGLASGDDTCRPGEWCILEWSAEEKALIGGLGGGTLGAAVGGIVGGIIGSTDHYEQRPTLERTISVGADSRGAAAVVTWRY